MKNDKSKKNHRTETAKEQGDRENQECNKRLSSILTFNK
jgi:hypothetical protein